MANDPDGFLSDAAASQASRFISTLWSAKNVLQLDRENHEDLAIADDVGDGTDDGSDWAFVWDSVNGVTNAPLRRIN
ncbi:hypothetical protein [Escherichia coli]